MFDFPAVASRFPGQVLEPDRGFFNSADRTLLKEPLTKELSTMKPATAPDLRRRELAQIHIAVQQLGMTDDDHRSLLWSVCQVKSAADLDWTGRKRYLDHLKKLGFKPRTKAGKSSQPRPRTGTPAPSSRPLAPDAQSQKIRALWLTLADAGVVRNRSEAALAAYVKRQTGVEALQWLGPAQASAVIESLKKWLSRQPHNNQPASGVNP